MSLCSQHFPDKVRLNCSVLGVSDSLSEMNVSEGSPGEETWAEDIVTEVTMEAGEVITPSHASQLYVEFRKYVSSRLDVVSNHWNCEVLMFKVSPFTLTVLMSGAFLCILVFFGFCYVVR